jgi:hypothetical protein
MRVCAYCSQKGKLTREELFPKSLVHRTPSYRANIDHTRPDKPLEAVPIVRDVCAQCNNVRLGALDSYAAKLGDKYFNVFLEKPLNVEFECDTERLLRWLLKLLFNSVRVSGLTTDAYAGLCPFILGRESDPGVKLDLLLGVIEPFRSETSNELVYPEHHGFADFAGTDFGVGVPAGRYTSLCRGVFLNSYLFCVISCRAGVTRPLRRRVLKLMRERSLVDISRPSCSVRLNEACMTAAAVMWSKSGLERK